MTPTGNGALDGPRAFGSVTQSMVDLLRLDSTAAAGWICGARETIDAVNGWSEGRIAEEEDPAA